nr:acyl carrier protein [Acanthopleuribacter pedis]
MLVPDKHHVLPAFIDAPHLNAAAPAWFYGVSRDLQKAARPQGTPSLPAAKVVSPAPPARSADPVPAAAPVGSLEDRISRWEQAGKPLAVETLTRYVTFDQLKQQDPVLIQRVYQLLYPDEASPSPDVTDTSPSEPEPLSRLVYETLLDVLKIDHIEAHEDFADYGLDSISAMVFSTRLEKRLDMEIPPQCLIDFPNIQTLSEHLKNRRLV